MTEWIDCPDCTSGGIIQRQECDRCGETRSVELTETQAAVYHQAIAVGADDSDAFEAAMTLG